MALAPAFLQRNSGRRAGVTAADLTHLRSRMTQADTIRPPPLPAINGVAGSGSLLTWELQKIIRQGRADFTTTRHQRCLGGPSYRGTNSLGMGPLWLVCRRFRL